MTWINNDQYMGSLGYDMPSSSIMPPESGGGTKGGNMPLPLAALIGGGVSLLSGLFGGASQRNQQDEANKLALLLQLKKKNYDAMKDPNYLAARSGVGGGMDARMLMGQIQPGSRGQARMAAMFSGLMPYMPSLPKGQQAQENPDYIQRLKEDIVSRQVPGGMVYGGPDGGIEDGREIM